ncbi:hypothetical protein FKR81_37610 [Lentzea tibetensis]|uniref:Uncharacterized protein n=1 Tax=Lentzea tibetensis TaxID=2591470 RepID=A0A563EH47_9PSEU|nr:hypothetical protein [Lentzea tibetensis]TWP45943.1 hypothetical protein FKR81_37610 [Lentzea tibetensis]
MDTLTKLAFAVLVVIALGVGWWLLGDWRKQRRRARATAWARQQVSPEKPPPLPQADDPTEPLDLWPTEESEMPNLVRPYWWITEPTEVLPRITDHRTPGE